MSFDWFVLSDGGCSKFPVVFLFEWVDLFVLEVSAIVELMEKIIVVGAEHTITNTKIN